MDHVPPPLVCVLYHSMVLIITVNFPSRPSQPGATLEACSVDDSVSHVIWIEGIGILSQPFQALRRVTCVLERKPCFKLEPEGHGHRFVSSPLIQTFTYIVHRKLGCMCCPCVMQPRPGACCSCTLLSHSLLQTCTDCSRTVLASYALWPPNAIHVSSWRPTAWPDCLLFFAVLLDLTPCTILSLCSLGRCVNIITGEDSSLPRVKPFKYTYEKEIVMYAYFKKLDYFSTECIYAPFAARGFARDFVKDLEVSRM